MLVFEHHYLSLYPLIAPNIQEIVTDPIRQRAKNTPRNAPIGIHPNKIKLYSNEQK